MVKAAACGAAIRGFESPRSPSIFPVLPNSLQQGLASPADRIRTGEVQILLKVGDRLPGQGFFALQQLAQRRQGDLRQALYELLSITVHQNRICCMAAPEQRDRDRGCRVTERPPYLHKDQAIFRKECIGLHHYCFHSTSGVVNSHRIKSDPGACDQKSSLWGRGESSLFSLGRRVWN